MTAPIRLHFHMAKMVALEAGIERTMDQLSKQASGHPDAAALVMGFHELAQTHRQALEARLNTIAGEMALPDGAVARLDDEEGDAPVSSALEHASTVLNQAITGYAMLRTITLRRRDSSLIGEGNTGDLAEQHTKNYASAVHRINRILHNVVLWELDQEGATCQCTCPSCGLGVCLCAQAPRLTLSNAWAELGPISDEAGVFVHPPRPGSAAANAGLRYGDVIVAADGEELESHFALQGAIGRRQPGEAIELRVRRGSGELEDVAVLCT